MDVPFNVADFDSIADFKVLAKSDTFLSNEDILNALSKCSRTQRSNEVTFFDSEADDFFPVCDPKTEEPFDPPVTYENVIRNLTEQLSMEDGKKAQAYTIFTHEGQYRPVIGLLAARDSDVLDDQHLVFITGESAL